MYFMYGVACSTSTGLQCSSVCVVQRGSVIVSDAVLISGAWFATRREAAPCRSLAFFLLVANAGLLVVDHIHFQYNGLLLGAHFLELVRVVSAHQAH